MDTANVLKLTGTGTTTLNQCIVYGISINKTLAGTLTVNENGTAVGQFAIATAPGDYHNVPGGVRYYKLTLVLSAGDDVTVFTKGL
jgi:hypothetical protein